MKTANRVGYWPATCLILVIVASSTASVGAEDKKKANSADATRLAEQIDVLIAARWQEAEIKPAAGAEGAEFLRRVWLDLAGKIPPAADVQQFLEDDDSGKRQRVVDDLLSGPNYITHFSRVWRTVMLPEVDTNPQFAFFGPSFENWLRKQLLDDVRWNKLVSDIITAPLTGNFQNGPESFYQVRSSKPENLAAATSRMFLGVRMECAQCHDHPFDRWTQKEFWSYAAFFASIERQPRRRSGFFARFRERLTKRTLKIPDTDIEVQPTFPDGVAPEIAKDSSPRESLAKWLTSDSNPWFARAAANRLWGHFFGIGLVDPVDDFGGSNPASHPELLTLLARELVEHDFDLRYLMRAITQTRAYQLSSQHTADSASDVAVALFARMPIKGLTAAQFFDSIAQATGTNADFSQQQFFRQTSRTQFIQNFNDSRSAPTERQQSVLLALAMMNGDIVSRATGTRDSVTLAAIAEYPLFTTSERIDALFVATLSRKPTKKELHRFASYVDSNDNGESRRDALGDVLWVLLNSSEFSLNH